MSRDLPPLQSQDEIDAEERIERGIVFAFTHILTLSIGVLLGAFLTRFFYS